MNTSAIIFTIKLQFLRVQALLLNLFKVLSLKFILCGVAVSDYGMLTTKKETDERDH